MAVKTPSTIVRGQILTLVNLAIRTEEPKRLAPANSLIAKKATKLAIAAIPIIVVRPIATIVVTVITVVTVVINFSVLLLL